MNNDRSIEIHCPSHQSLKIELDDGSIQEIEYTLPIDRYDIMRIIYHQLKYDRIYDWEHFYQSTIFVRKDNGIETSYPLNYSSTDLIYHLVLPEYPTSLSLVRNILTFLNGNLLILLDPLARLKRWLWPNSIQ